jgi:two-component system, cell cycle response regulator
MLAKQSVAPQEKDYDIEDTTLTQRLVEQRQCCVLVVDDDELVRARLRTILVASNYHVEEAASGAEALRALAEVHCHIVLTDWQMPDMSGPELCRQLRQAHMTDYIYVLMLTVRGAKEDMLEGLSAGADDYVVKGAPVDVILARLQVGRRITHIDHALRASNQENRRLSFTDQLTGAYNRRHFVKYLEREIKRSQRYRHELSVLSCDIDDFKQVNDRFGHQAGDELLRDFVVRAASCIRVGCDWLARVGGDEFMIVLPETGTAGANTVVKKLQQALASTPAVLLAGTVPFSVSIGVTSVDASHECSRSLRIDDMVRAADRGMYANKRRGPREPAAHLAPFGNALDQHKQEDHEQEDNEIN